MISYIDLVNDVIGAAITAPSHSGITVFRVCGPGSLKIIRQIAPFLPESPSSHSVHYGFLRDLKSSDKVDEVLISYFEHGRSFTGDETVEISVHGGVINASHVSTLIFGLGIREAERGEFSFRAFYNGKIDLVQAEAIKSLVHSQNDKARKQSVKQLLGQLSSKFTSLESDIVSLLAQVEASIDFSTEDITPYSSSQLLDGIQSVLTTVSHLITTYQSGKILNEGLSVALVGDTNVGKSSLFNCLVGDDRAIVTDIAGTTRDVVDCQWSENASVKILDTAGVRETSNPIESIGISRTEKVSETADVLLWVLDVSRLEECVYRPKVSDNQSLMVVFNKSDLVSNPSCIVKSFLDSQNEYSGHPSCLISTKNTDKLQGVKDYLNERCLDLINQSGQMSIQARHLDELLKVRESLSQALCQFSGEPDYDLIAFDLQTALGGVFSILGKEYDDEVLDRVFSDFCLGK